MFEVKLLALGVPTALTSTIYKLTDDSPIVAAAAKGWIYGRFGMPNAPSNWNLLSHNEQLTALMAPVPPAEATHRVRDIRRVSMLSNEYIVGTVEFLSSQAKALYDGGFLVFGARAACTQQYPSHRIIQEFVAFELVSLEPDVDRYLADQAGANRAAQPTTAAQPYIWSVPCSP